MNSCQKVVEIAHHLTPHIYILVVAQEERRFNEFINLLDDTFIKQFNLDQERLDLPIVCDIGKGKRVAVTYAAGYVLSMVKSSLACEKCKASLSGTSTSALRPASPGRIELLHWKDCSQELL